MSNDLIKASMDVIREIAKTNSRTISISTVDDKLTTLTIRLPNNYTIFVTKSEIYSNNLDILIPKPIVKYQVTYGIKLFNEELEVITKGFNSEDDREDYINTKLVDIDKSTIKKEIISIYNTNVESDYD